MIPKKEEYIITKKSTGEVIHSGTDRRRSLTDVWNWMGITLPDIIKVMMYCGVGIFYGTKIYIGNLQMQDFMIQQAAINKHLIDCSENRDKWATAKYGHSFTCGKPDDGWTPNMGNLK